MGLREAAQQALEALESDPDAMVDCGDGHWDFKRDLAITALRAALAEPTCQESRQVEPVGYGVFEDGNLHDSFRLEHEAKLFAALKGEHAEVGALYRSPPKREPLTEQELEPIRRRMMMEAYNAADDGDSERYNALKVMANDVLDMLLGGEK